MTQMKFTARLQTAFDTLDEYLRNGDSANRALIMMELDWLVSRYGHRVRLASGKLTAEQKRTCAEGIVFGRSKQT
jgi:hypothetical protein